MVTPGYDLVTVERERGFRDCEAGENYWRTKDNWHAGGIRGRALLAKRCAANLLGGRANRYELHGLTAGELGGEFDLDRMLNHRHLPRIYEASCPKRMLDAYVADSLKEEVAAEGLLRNLPTFSEFLDVAAGVLPHLPASALGAWHGLTRGV